MFRGRTAGSGLWVAGVLFSAALASGAPKPGKPAPKGLKPYPSKYYIIYTDLDANAVREASARMTAMAEEYRRRTKGFAGVIRKRLAFYLYSKLEDYHEAGAPKGSAGVYHPGKEALMAVAQHGTGDQLWYVVQHEGFHQFVHMVIGGQIPIWVNEGMAEYFGQGVWTGDGFVTGVIPPGRLKSLQGYIREEKLTPFREMLLMTHTKWSGDLTDSDKPGDADGTKKTGETDDDRARRARINYDQAWSMVHFLVHAHNGKYRKPFSSMIRDISRGRNGATAFQSRFGRNLKAFEKRYKDWWLSQPEHPTSDLYIQAVVETLTSFLARAVSQGQKFATAEAFFSEARAGTLKSHKTQWLPPSLLNNALLYARPWKKGWSLENVGRVPKLILTWSDGKTFTGTFTHARGKADRVKVTVAKKKE